MTENLRKPELQILDSAGGDSAHSLTHRAPRLISTWTFAVCLGHRAYLCDSTIVMVSDVTREVTMFAGDV